MLLFLLGVGVGAVATYLLLSGPRGPGDPGAPGAPGEWLRRALGRGDAQARLREGDAGSEPGAPAQRGERGASPARRGHAAGRAGEAPSSDATHAAGQRSRDRAGLAGPADAGAAGAAASPAALGAARGGAAASRAEAAGAATGAAAAGESRVALVIDDLGRSLEDLDSLRQLGVPITYAVLPFEVQTPEVVAALRRRHEEILCHLPMEPKSGGNPGPGALRAGMSPEELRQSTLAAIAAVPGAVGVNNHMGSALSADPGSMATILGVVASRGLYFLDSRTSAKSVGFRLATALGVPAAERQVFLDDDLRPEAVAGEFQRLLEVARSRGAAIAIGHPHPATLAILAAEVPRAQALGYRFVAVSALLDRPAAAPPPATGR